MPLTAQPGSGTHLAGRFAMSAAETTKPTASGLPLLALLAGGIAVGFSPIFVRLSDLGPLASGFYRLALAIPVLWAFQLLAPEKKTRPSAETSASDRLLLILTGAIFGLDIIFWHSSLAYTTVADATLISNTAPILVATGAFFIFGERMKPLFVAGLALAIVGIVSLALQKSATVDPANRFLGNTFAFCAALSYASYLLLVAKLRRRFTTQKIVMYTTISSAFVLLPLAVLVSPTMWPMSIHGWLILLALSFISHIGGQAFMTYALAHLPASFSSLTQLTQAVVAAIAAWAILNEPLTAMKLASAMAILIGIFLCSRARSTG